VLRSGGWLPGALSLVTAVAIAGCVGGVTVTSTHQFGAMTGHLVGGLSPDGGEVACMWLEDQTGRRVDVIWPDGWDQAFHPLRLLDDSGQIVAREGDVLTVSGPADGVGDSMCSPGAIFVAEQVEIVARAGVAPEPSR
jgi:hypothetical protein